MSLNDELKNLEIADMFVIWNIDERVMTSNRFYQRSLSLKDLKTDQKYYKNYTDEIDAVYAAIDSRDTDQIMSALNSLNNALYGQVGVLYDTKGNQVDRLGESVYTFNPEYEKNWKYYNEDNTEVDFPINPLTSWDVTAKELQETFEEVKEATEETTQSMWPDEATQAGYYSGVLTVGGANYDKDGNYIDRDNNYVNFDGDEVGFEGKVEAPFIKGDEWELFMDRDDIFEIQVLISEASGGTILPEKIGVWDKGLAAFMRNILAMANDTWAWFKDKEEGLGMKDWWTSTLNDFIEQTKRGTDLAELMLDVGYAGLSADAPTVKESKDTVDTLFAERNLVASAEDYKALGEALIDFSSQATNRNAEINNRKSTVNSLIFSNITHLTEMPQKGTHRWVSYQEAKEEGRLQEDGEGGWYIFPKKDLIQGQMGDMSQPLSPSVMLGELIDERYGTRIEAVEDRNFIRNNTALFRNQFLGMNRVAKSEERDVLG